MVHRWSHPCDFPLSWYIPFWQVYTSVFSFVNVFGRQILSETQKVKTQHPKWRQVLKCGQPVVPYGSSELHYRQMRKPRTSNTHPHPQTKTVKEKKNHSLSKWSQERNVIFLGTGERNENKNTGVFWQFVILNLTLAGSSADTSVVLEALGRKNIL